MFQSHESLDPRGERVCDAVRVEERWTRSAKRGIGNDECRRMKDELYQTVFEFLQVFKDIGIEVEFAGVG